MARGVEAGAAGGAAVPNRLAKQEGRVADKWLAALAAEVQNELNRVSLALTGRVKELAERYAAPLPELSEDVEVLSGKVDAHLKRMGFAWR